MMVLKMPLMAMVIGEGGSGGALGIGVCDRVLILENAYYSVISPEGCAAILWKDRANAAQAAQALKLTAKDLLELGVVDEAIPEPLGGAHKDYDATAAALKKCVLKHLEKLLEMKTSELLEARYKKYRQMGVYSRVEPKKRRSRSKVKSDHGTPPPPPPFFFFFFFFFFLKSHRFVTSPSEFTLTNTHGPCLIYVP